MTRLELIPDFLSLLGGFALTWPALRAGRMLGRAATAARNAARARDATSVGIFRKIQNA